MYRFQPELNPRILGPVTRTLTTRPPMATILAVFQLEVRWWWHIPGVTDEYHEKWQSAGRRAAFWIVYLPSTECNHTTATFREICFAGAWVIRFLRAVCAVGCCDLEEYCRVSSGSIVSDYGLDDRAMGFDSRRGQRIFPVASVSRPALGPTQPPVQWVPGVKARSGRDADHSPPSSAEVENE
jgi:hypothetical protein